MVLQYRNILSLQDFTEHVAAIGLNGKGVFAVEAERNGFGEGRFSFEFRNCQAGVRLAERFEGRHKADSAAAVVCVGGNALFAELGEGVGLKCNAAVKDGDGIAAVLHGEINKDFALTLPCCINGNQRVLDVVANERLQIGLRNKLADDLAASARR